MAMFDTIGMVSLDPYRLPTTIRPNHYRITLDTDPAAPGFSGTVVIDAEVIEATDSIVLNGDGLDVTSAEIRVGSGSSSCEIEIDAEHQRIMLASPSTLEPGRIELELAFSGVYNSQLVGIYTSRFSTDEGKTESLVTTQFEAPHARKAFPCWDEPEYKATFEVCLIINPEHEAVSNSAEVSRTDTTDGRLLVSFAPTIKMSTYLVAFVVGPLEMTDPVDVDGVPLRIVHTPGKGELTSFALEAGAFALRYFSDYFGIPYPGDKLDMVAIPDFAFGAMENLGCITYREIVLLVDPNNATQPELQRIADVVNHEIAHMWFGDLVTMKWWNGIWLNEAFATFMEMRCTDAFRPEWQRWVDFSLSRTEAFDTDGLASTRPVEFEVVSPEDAEGMFDILTYEKGAAVVRMLEQYLGEDRFQAGIRRYMAENQFGNAETTDLWDAIEAETGDPVRRIMDSWIFQGGFPLVSLEAKGSTLTFSQEPMAFASIDDKDSGDPSRTWSAPLHYRWRPSVHASSQPAPSDRILLEGSSTTVELSEEPDWLVANASSHGFFRVAYSDAQLDRLADVALSELQAVERYALIDDAWASVLAGRSSTPSFLNLLEAMSGEENRSVWVRIISGLNALDRLVSGDARENLQEIAHDVMAPALANLGLAPSSKDDEQTLQLRGDLISGMGITANDPEIQEEAKRTLAVAKREPELVEASILSASVRVVASIGDEADFDDFVQAWTNATTPQDEIRYLNALALFSDPKLMARMQNMALEGRIRSQNAPYLLGAALGGRETSRSTWAFITNNWAKLIELFPTGSIVRMVGNIAALDTEEEAKAVAEFFEANPIATGGRTLEQRMEQQRVRVALRNREHERLTTFLSR